MISQKEGIENNEQVYFHINIKDLGSDFYLTKIALNGVKPEKYSFKSTYAKFETYVYVDTDRSLKINNKVFYVPDSNNWEFIIYAVGDRIISIEKLTPYELIKENSEGKIKL
ncbi:hypothetical protein RG47T_1200 [Mucilaginibacter polytrichastri]|uniref:Uncharacterized protein n=1 Tax=Mucilaginibacter polytrichastri TaxID=1302689 RepID=A0A1Q5ZVG0_9SPHI|nr:hypothetical protein RG47T_1200 [Mucilaginibacter polytrichastri]